MADWHDEHEAFKKNLPKIQAQNAAREINPSALSRFAQGMADKLQELRVREGGTTPKTPEHAPQQQAPARPSPIKEQER